MLKLINFKRNLVSQIKRNSIRSLHNKSLNSLPSNFKITEEIRDALETGKPVVALESTIISHGMPYPQNVETAAEVEGIIREQGSIPATIALLNGNVHIGLEKEQLNMLGEAGLKARKVSRRDLSYTISEKLIGATTVASTMILAHKVGIPIFVTGGIGGVHRGAEKTFDISADLTELGRTPITVICAGAKSILDIGSTLEYLETQGVAVATLGETDYFPAFFTPTSPYKSPIHLKKIEQATNLIDSHLKLGLQSGIVIGVPIPPEFSKAGDEIQSAINMAVEESVAQNIEGKHVTPFLLKRVNELTKGKSLSSNISLVKNNAVVGGRLANMLSKRQYSTDNRKGN
ncbi:erwinia chrysanthemi IndA protein-like protein-like protein [Neoconidiobolus thromboides FSU 785]|nr:erwinia chrysanthemi IndA protein-like protein-like protein [Neoconidiobolus thromboides FSU 785]